MASVYAGIALLNSSPLQDNDDILLVMAAGSCFMMVGGWLDWAWMYSSSLFGFRYGKYLPVSRSKVTSRKSVRFKRISTVTFKSHSWKVLMMVFLALSACGPEKLNADKPSSL